MSLDLMILAKELIFILSLSKNKMKNNIIKE
jgi:hypothetical protein